MYSPLLNSSLSTCDNALAELFTTSVELIGRIRAIIKELKTISEDSDYFVPLPPHGMRRFREASHPMNRLPQRVFDSVRRTLELHMRADPGKTDGLVTYRVCSPGVNIWAELRALVAENPVGFSRDEDVPVLHTSTLQRMIVQHLEQSGSRVSFYQNDHNCCTLYKDQERLILSLQLEINLAENGVCKSGT